MNSPSAPGLQVEVLYFAALRERFGTGHETLLLPPRSTVADLLAVLVARGEPWAQALAPGRAFRVAVDQTMATPEWPLSTGCEVAIFPPVTGG
jgi:molybdopterin converting factor subunit 1